jgi:hypothetical protein
MPSNEGHIHWDGSADSTVNYLGQELRLTSEISNATAMNADPDGTIRVKADGSVSLGLALPSDSWQPVPGTVPLLEARSDGHYPVGYIRVRQA